MQRNARTVPEHGGNLSWAARRYGKASTDFVDFSANINPLGPPAAVVRGLQSSLNHIQHYPDPDGVAFRQVVADRWGIPLGAVRPLNGAAEGFMLLLQIWRPRRVIIPGPAFAGYARAARAVGAQPVHVPLAVHPGTGEYTLDIAAVVGNIHPGAGDTVVVANPNNPTGHTVALDVLMELARQVERKGAYLLLDEAFLDFVPNERELSFCLLAASRRNVAVVRSLTKMYALPGLRLGFVVGEPKLLAELDRIRQPWPVNSLALAAGVVALTEGSDHVAATLSLVDTERTWLSTELSRLPAVTILPSAVNFMLLQFRSPWPAAVEFADQLGQRGILVRIASNFPGLGPCHLRIAVRRRWENERLLGALNDVGVHVGAVETVE